VAAKDVVAVVAAAAVERCHHTVMGISSQPPMLDGFEQILNKKYEFNIPGISAREIGNIVANLNQMKAAISKRVSTIK
jgi:hypothetical protein